MADQSAESPILDLITTMTEASIETSNLDADTLMLVRIAALVAVDAPPASYLINLGAAGDAGVNVDEVQGVLAAVAPIVGTTRVVSAAGNLARAYGLAVGLTEAQAG